MWTSKQLIVQKLHFAAAKGFHEIVKCLMEWCPELGALRDHRGSLAIHLATAHSHFDCVKHLCRPEVVDLISHNGRTALHYAIEQRDTAAVKYLVEHNADVDARQSHGLRNPPLIEALRRGHRVIVNTLLDAKADIEIMDEDGWRPLHFAARYGYTELASRLLDLRCERQAQTHLGETPFFLAISYGRPHIIQLFMKHDMIVSNVETLEGATCAHVAADQGRLDILQELVKIDRKIIFKTTAAGVDVLYIAALSGYHTIVDFLIRSGMKPSGMGHFVDTPLAGAAGNGCIKTVDVLLSLGAEVNKTDALLRTPLLLTVKEGYLNIAHRLLKAGANPHLRDSTGSSAFDYCVDDSAMMDVLKPWRSISRIHGMAQSSNHRLFALAQCIIRSARAVADCKRNANYDGLEVNDVTWHFWNLRSLLFRLGLLPVIPPRLPAQKTHTAVPAKKVEILREWRILFADSNTAIVCSFCGRSLRRESYACPICGSAVCLACHSKLRLETQLHMRIEVWKELQQLKKDMIPISTILMDLAHQDSRVVGGVLSQDNLLRHWVLAKRQEYAKWRKRWGIHHFRTRGFHGWKLVHTMARVLSHEHDWTWSDDQCSSGASESEQHNATQKTRSLLTERWQDIFSTPCVDEDFNTTPCTHSSFLKVSKRRQSLREPQVIFNSAGNLTPEVLDLLAQKYEDFLASGDLTFEKLQTRRFTDSIVEGTVNGNNESEQAIGGERSPGPGTDSRNETSSLESASDTTSDATDASVVSDMKDEAHIDVEEILENLLVKRGSLVKGNLLTDENDLVLETAWKFVQAIVYHDTPRQSLKDIAEQGSEWHTAPGTPVAFALGGSSGGSSNYSTAESI